MPNGLEGKRNFICLNLRLWVFPPNHSLLNQPRLLRLNPLEQFRDRFVAGVLGDELAADGEVEDGLAELLDVS